MQFHSGFSLHDDVHFFDGLLHTSEFTIAGFSYGAIAAFRECLSRLHEFKRIDRLQLFSPAFFQDQSAAFRRLQLKAYTQDESAYLAQFDANIFYPHTQKSLKHTETKIEELQELLDFVWSREELRFVVSRGVKIEVYLGGKDAIINASNAREFFKEFATITYIKDANHLLQTS